MWVASEGAKSVRRFVLPGRSAPDAAAWGKVKVSSKTLGSVAAMAALGDGPEGGLVLGGDSLMFAPHGSAKASVRMHGGHAAPIVALAASPDGRLVVSADAERVICAWAAGALAPAGGKSPKSVAPALEATLEASPRRVRVFGLPASQYAVAAVSPRGVEVVVVQLEELAVREAGRVSFSSEDIAGDLDVLDAVVHASPAPCIAVATGSSLAPVVVRAALLGPDGSLAPSWTASAAAHDASSSSSSSSARAPKAIGGTVASAVPDASVASSLKDGTSEAKRARRDTEDDDDAEDDEESMGVSMADRLRALTGAMQAAPVRTGGTSTAAASASASVAAADSSPASMATVLGQALHSDDTAQIELVLSTTDPEAVDATVARLEARSVVPLLRQVVSRFEAQPSRGAPLSRWLRAVMVHHAAALASTPGLVSRLAGVYHIIDSRLAAYRKLLRLTGRLDLLLGQLGSQTSAAALSGVVDEASAVQIALA